METEKSSNKIVLTMDLHLEPKVWYLFIKHPMKPTLDNETINKDRLVLLHCITKFNTMNISKIIVQEIQACSKKKDDMIYFPCLITTLWKRQGVLESTDGICYPQVVFDTTTIHALLKPKGKKSK